MIPERESTTPSTYLYGSFILVLAQKMMPRIAALFRLRLFRNYRQHDVRRMLRIVVDGVGGYHGLGVLIERLAGVGIHVETREVAAGDVHANAVALGKQNGGWIQLNAKLV